MEKTRREMKRRSQLWFLGAILLSVSHGVGGMMNCIEARHQCLKEKHCHDVLTMLNKVCGPELVACSTTTPMKCKMLLATLNSFDYFKHCTCREIHEDSACQSFKDTISNHPCLRVEPLGYDISVMPNCYDAHESCKSQRSCIKEYVDFVHACAFQDITCTSQESEKCLESWKKIRHTPVFGCVCPPPPQMNAQALLYGDIATINSWNSASTYETCMTTYNRTHANPCLGSQTDIARATEVETTQALCHVALEKCLEDKDCKPLLQDVMVWCEHAHCEPDRCRTALMDFYERVGIIHRLQVAFCVCRQSDPDGECLTAMRKLHPTCAERHAGRDPMKCHKISEQCRQSGGVCSKKLQEYEQNCATDAMTGTCAGTHRSCQKAVMNILGTELHATCVCKGTDFLHQHDCYTWQKLLWANPCVIESHLKLHQEIAEGGSESLDADFRPPAPVTTPATRHIYVEPTPEEDSIGSHGKHYGTVREYGPEGNLPRPSGSYGIEHTRPGWENSRTGIHRGHIQPGGSNNEDDLIDKTRYDIVESEVGRGGVSRGDIFGTEIDRGEESPRRGIIGGGTDGRRVFGTEVGISEPKWSSGRHRGGGISFGKSGERSGGGVFSSGGRFGGNQEQNGSGSRSSWGRGSGLNVGGNRDRFGIGTSYDRDQSGSESNGRGRGLGIGSGHRGTQIVIASPDRGSGSERDWSTSFGSGRRQGGGRSWGGGSPGEYPDVFGGRGNLPDNIFPVTRPPMGRPDFETPAPPGIGRVTPGPHAIPPPSPHTTTTTTIATTTIPRRTCTIKNTNNGHMTNLQIPEGSRRRIYNSSDCSALCECREMSHDAEPEAVCITLRCIENKSCNTQDAMYPHAAPYYLAYRGVCDCYAGNFICQKPNPENYTLGPGVYLFLGYSRGEMEILQPVTSKNELDALNQMEEILVKEYGFKCHLNLKHHIGENVIAIATLRVEPGVYISPFRKQRKEKEECANPLQKLAEKINARPRHSDIIMDAHLSMFILAEVDVNFPEAQTSFSSVGDHLRPYSLMTYLAALFTTLLLLHHHLEAVVPLGVCAT